MKKAIKEFIKEAFIIIGITQLIIAGWIVTLMCWALLLVSVIKYFFNQH